MSTRGTVSRAQTTARHGNLPEDDMASKRILVGLDGSKLAESVLPTVATLAARLGAEVTLLQVVHGPPPGERADHDAAVHERDLAHAYLRRISRRLRTTGVPIHSAVVGGEAAAEILRRAERDGSSLVALGTHGRSGFARWRHGSVAEAVLHGTSLPVLLLRPTTGGTTPAAEPSRVVVPLDGSESAATALPVAESLADALSARITLVRAVETLSAGFAAEPLSAPFVDYERLLDDARADAQRHLEGVAAELRTRGRRVDVVTATGIPAEVIAAAAQSHPGSLLVMATHGETGWRALLLGSVARRVVELAAGPVVLVPPALQGDVSATSSAEIAR